MENTLINNQTALANPYTALIVECVSESKVEKAKEYFSMMRKDQRRRVILNLVEWIHFNAQGSASALYVLAIKILIEEMH